MITATITKHMAVSIGIFERLDDQVLVDCFTPEGGEPPTALEVREHLKDLRSQGFVYMPCSCGNYDASGACKGAA